MVVLHNSLEYWHAHRIPLAELSMEPAPKFM